MPLGPKGDPTEGSHGFNYDSNINTDKKYGMFLGEAVILPGLMIEISPFVYFHENRISL